MATNKYDRVKRSFLKLQQQICKFKKRISEVIGVHFHERKGTSNPWFMLYAGEYNWLKQASPYKLYLKNMIRSKIFAFFQCFTKIRCSKITDFSLEAFANYLIKESAKCQFEILTLRKPGGGLNEPPPIVFWA